MRGSFSGKLSLYLGSVLVLTFLLAWNPSAKADDAALVALGRALFFDNTLSNPSGMSCATCHAPQAGWTYPSSSVNQRFGVAPGAVAGRFGNRRVPSIGYTKFIQNGPPVFDTFSYIGGIFYDGRAPTLTAQVAFPMENPNEMNNTVHNLGSPALIVHALQSGPNAAMFKQVFGENIFSQSTAGVFGDLREAISAFETSTEVSPFSSKYDAYVAGKAQLTASELNGLRLFTGSYTGRPGGRAFTKNAECALCHQIQASASLGPDIFTDSRYFNTGVPKNLNSPFYKQTSASSDPAGYNPLGLAYFDRGLGDYLYPQMGLPVGNDGPGTNGFGDFLNINGAFRTTILRNLDKRPNSSFVKAYGHNGFFKSLKQVVHFYNTRNLTTVPGEVMNLSNFANPTAGLKGTALWPPPENVNPSTLVNPAGLTPAKGGIIGNLGLTDSEETDIVNFISTLSDSTQ